MGWAGQRGTSPAFFCSPFFYRICLRIDSRFKVQLWGKMMDRNQTKAPELPATYQRSGARLLSPKRTNGGHPRDLDSREKQPHGA